jgi:hypothetical protein
MIYQNPIICYNFHQQIDGVEKQFVSHGHLYWNVGMLKHNTKGDLVVRAKEKLVDEIMWLKENTNDYIPKQYVEVNKEALNLQPKENLNNMAEQLKHCQISKCQKEKRE